jgi:hypothetical protein
MGDQVSEQLTVGRAQLSHVRMVIDRNDQYMNWGLWIYVPKGDCARIRRHYRRWYVAGGDTAEQAIRHGGILTSGTPARAWTYMVAMLRTRGAAPLGAEPRPVTGLVLPGTGPAHVLAHDQWLWGVLEAAWKRGLATRCRNTREYPRVNHQR